MVIEGYKRVLNERPKDAKVVSSIFEVIDITPDGDHYTYDKNRSIYLNVGKLYYEYPMSIIDSDEFCINDYISKVMVLI